MPTVSGHVSCTVAPGQKPLRPAHPVKVLFIELISDGSFGIAPLKLLQLMNMEFMFFILVDDSAGIVPVRLKQLA